ncbi:MAG: cation transporter [Xanthomonadales bacterium]|nr:cation transporter [Gammaproteobacteria bacterium]NND55709.1 cation transporter [Xanthomonadales bacterium]NNK52269.1 cation transporter [Xanthomonadales bacterium]
MAGQADSLKSVRFALFANTAIAIAKGVAALLTGSGAMLAEAIHSVADAGNQLLLILGLRQTKKAPTDDHPLGFGKSIYFWSFLVAVILFSLGGMFSLYEGVHKLTNPEPLRYPWVAIFVLVFVIAVFVAVEVKELLIGQSVEPATLDKMREFLSGRSEIREVFSLLTMQFGPDAMVAVKARMVPTGSERNMIAAIDRVERDFRTRFPIISWLFFEPDVED